MIKTLKINSIFGGISPSQYFGKEDSYNSSTAIDPDLPIISTDIRTSGYPVPVGSAVFSSTNVTSAPIRIITQPKSNTVYTVQENGRLVSYTSGLASETLIASTVTVTIASPAVFSLTAHGLSAGDIVYFSTSGALPTGLTVGTAYYVILAGLTADAFEVSTTLNGSAVNTSGTQSGTHKITMACYGAEYYNNYIYMFTGTNVSRYGPLDGTPALAHGFWVTTLSLTALTNTTYPTLRSVRIPNHSTFNNGDSLYFIDFKDGQGLIHRLTTKKGASYEGEVNGTVIASAYTVLDLPFGFYPTSITSFGTALFILGIYTVDTTVNQGRSAFVIWDPTNTTTFTLGPVFLPDPLATACMNINGVVYIWSGNASNGVRLSAYQGGEYVKEIMFQEEGLPPLYGAVDSLGSRVVWGGFSTYPSAGAVVWAYGSKDSRVPKGLHNISKTSSSGATPIVSALKYVLQSSSVTPQLVTGWRDASAYGLDKYSASATLASYIRWMFNLGVRHSIHRIVIPLAGAVAANTTITPKVYFDDLSTSQSPTVINNTNYPSKRKIVYSGTELKDFIGKNNFTLEIAQTGTNPLPVALPITIDVDVKESDITE